MVHISNFFNLPLGKGHANYNFLDINLSKDNKLFIDALLCQCHDNNYSIEAHKTLDSYTRCVFNAIKDNDVDKQLYLFSKVGETKETYLGMSRYSNQGKGSSLDILLPVFKQATSILGEIPDISLVPIVSGNFDKDRMSDLISRLCLKVLYDFTIDECLNHDIQLSQKLYVIGYHWDYTNESWKLLKGQIPTYNNEPILFTPKNWVCTSSILSPQSFIAVEWLSYRQSIHLQEKTSLASFFNDKGEIDYKKPKKVDVRRNDLNGKNYKKVIQNFLQTSIGKEFFNKFFIRKYENVDANYQHLSDLKLDAIVYQDDSKKSNLDISA